MPHLLHSSISALPARGGVQAPRGRGVPLGLPRADAAGTRGRAAAGRGGAAQGHSADCSLLATEGPVGGRPPQPHPRQRQLPLQLPGRKRDSGQGGTRVTNKHQHLQPGRRRHQVRVRSRGTPEKRRAGPKPQDGKHLQDPHLRLRNHQRPAGQTQGRQAREARKGGEGRSPREERTASHAEGQGTTGAGAHGRCGPAAAAWEGGVGPRQGGRGASPFLPGFFEVLIPQQYQNSTLITGACSGAAGWCVSKALAPLTALMMSGLRVEGLMMEATLWVTWASVMLRRGSRVPASVFFSDSCSSACLFLLLQHPINYYRQHLSVTDMNHFHAQAQCYSPTNYSPENVPSSPFSTSPSPFSNSTSAFSTSPSSFFPSFSPFTRRVRCTRNPPSNMRSAALRMTKWSGPALSLTRSERYWRYLPEKFSPLQRLMMGLTRTEGLGLRMGCPCSPNTPPPSSLSMQSAQRSRIYRLATASEAYRSRQEGSPQNCWSTVMSSKGFSQARRPTMHPRSPWSSTICFPTATLLMPPLISKVRCGKSACRRQTRSQMSGGMERFWAGLRPFSRAFRAWITKCRMALASPDTSRTKAVRNSQESNSSTPSRHLTVHGMVTARAMAAIHSRTNSGSFIRQAPKDPCCTRGLGQPTLRLISSQPYCWPRMAACARR